MKKFMIIGAAALMLVSGVAAIAAQPVSESPARTTEASAKTDYVDCKFNCRDFTGLDVSGIVKVKLAKSDFYKVKVTLPEELAEYLDVHVSEGVLRIGWSKNIPSRIQRKLGDLTCTAEVTMPELRKLEMCWVFMWVLTSSVRCVTKAFRSISGVWLSSWWEPCSRLACAGFCQSVCLI